MRRWIAAIIFGLIASLSPAASAQAPAEASFTSYAEDWDRLFTETQGLPEAERVAAMRAGLGRLFPGFYAPRSRTDDRYNAVIERSLEQYPALRERYLAAAGAFRAAFDRGSARFRTFFPDYRRDMPAYVLHSMGEMDGGTREIDGHTVLVFGTDVIARIHDTDTIGPFLDHELFHVYHARFFPECDPIWCALWTEGLATYVAERMNPGATQRQLLLTFPQPIAEAVDPRLAEAVCLTRSKLESTDPDDYRRFFQASPSEGPFPPRFGYYIGYLVAKRIGAEMPLPELAAMRPEQVRPLIERTLGEMADCPA